MRWSCGRAIGTDVWSWEGAGPISATPVSATSGLTFDGVEPSWAVLDQKEAMLKYLPASSAPELEHLNAYIRDEVSSTCRAVALSRGRALGL